VKSADEKYILRFEQAGHRERIKQQAAQAKRSLNAQLLVLIEAGEQALYPQEPLERQAGREGAQKKE